MNEDETKTRVSTFQGGITAIIPAHNAAATLPVALASVANQRPLPTEVIVVDDASKDGTQRVLEQIDKLNLRVLRRETAGPGGYAARNLGIEQTKTDWLTFLDADDIWKDGHIRSAEAVIEAFEHVDLIFFGYQTVKGNERRNRIMKNPGLCSRTEALKAFSGSQIIHTNGVVVKRELLLRAGGFMDSANFKRGADSELWLRLIWHARGIFFSDKVTSAYMRDNSGIISKGAGNVTSYHPVAYRVGRLLQEDLEPNERSLLKRLANRKTLEWYDQTAAFAFATRHQFLRQLYWSEIRTMEKLRVLLRFFAKV